MGIDKPSSMIELANQSFPQETYQNLRFKIEDIPYLTSCDTFDLITSFSGLHWAESQVTALEKIKQLLILPEKSLF